MATKVSSRQLPPLPEKPGDDDNWVEKAGGLPDYFVRVAKHIYWQGNGKYTVDHAIAGAIEVSKKRAAEGNKEAAAAVAQWEKMKAKDGSSKKLSVPVGHSSEGPTVTVPASKQGKRAKLAKAIRTFNANKKKYTPEQRKKIKARIAKIARDNGVAVKLSDGIIQRRPFNEAKYRRVGGKFAAKPSSDVPTSKGGKPQTAKAAIEGLGLGASFDIPGISGKIERTEQGYVVTGPNGFKTTASTSTEAIAVAARLLRQKMNK